RSYRDGYSRNYMAGLDVSWSSDEVVPDLVFALPSEWYPAWRPADCPPKVIGVGVMAYFGWNVGEARGREIYSKYVNQLARFVAGLLAAGYRVRLLIGERHTDAQTAQDVLGAIGPVELSCARERLEAAPI